jgi:hypothetical protein
MPEHLFAAFLGALISALRHSRAGLMRALKVALSGFTLAYFVAADVVGLSAQFLSVSISHGAAFFLVAYFGADLLEKTAYLIQSYRAATKWK